MNKKNIFIFSLFILASYINISAQGSEGRFVIYGTDKSDQAIRKNIVFHELRKLGISEPIAQIIAINNADEILISVNVSRNKPNVIKNGKINPNYFNGSVLTAFMGSLKDILRKNTEHNLNDIFTKSDGLIKFADAKVISYSNCIINQDLMYDSIKPIYDNILNNLKVITFVDVNRNNIIINDPTKSRDTNKIRTDIINELNGSFKSVGHTATRFPFQQKLIPTPIDTTQSNIAEYKELFGSDNFRSKAFSYSADFYVILTINNITFEYSNGDNNNVWKITDANVSFGIYDIATGNAISEPNSYDLMFEITANEGDMQYKYLTRKLLENQIQFQMAQYPVLIPNETPSTLFQVFYSYLNNIMHPSKLSSGYAFSFAIKTNQHIVQSVTDEISAKFDLKPAKVSQQGRFIVADFTNCTANIYQLRTEIKDLFAKKLGYEIIFDRTSPDLFTVFRRNDTPPPIVQYEFKNNTTIIIYPKVINPNFDCTNIDTATIYNEDYDELNAKIINIPSSDKVVLKLNNSQFVSQITYNITLKNSNNESINIEAYKP